MPSNMLMKMRVGKQLGEVFEKMENKLEALPISRTQLSVFMSNAREILRNASFASNASNDQSFYTNMAAIIKSVNDSDQAMERITNITKRIQGTKKIAAYHTNYYDNVTCWVTVALIILRLDKSFQDI